MLVHECGVGGYGDDLLGRRGRLTALQNFIPRWALEMHYSTGVVVIETSTMFALRYVEEYGIARLQLAVNAVRILLWLPCKRGLLTNEETLGNNSLS